MNIAILLPYKENFTKAKAGAVSIFIKDTVVKSKYKKEVDTSKSYFSNDTYIFHYDMEIELIDEIRQLLKGNTDE